LIWVALDIALYTGGIALDTACKWFPWILEKHDAPTTTVFDEPHEKLIALLILIIAYSFIFSSQYLRDPSHFESSEHTGGAYVERALTGWARVGRMAGRWEIQEKTLSWSS
jgi:hypothetical protein